VHGLYRAFPPLDPPVYVRPQLKPSHGICSFTTMTFGTHRGADQGAGRSTSGRDLLHLLGASTSASPPSTASLLQLPGLTSTRPGRHMAVPDLHRHLRSGTRFHPADICGPGVDSGTPSAGIYVFRPEYTSLGQIITILAYSGRILQVLGHVAAAWPTWAGAAQSRCGPGRLPPGGLAPPSSRPAHPDFPAAVFWLGPFPVSAMGP
jgi:hypothetical protein